MAGVLVHLLPDLNPTVADVAEITSPMRWPAYFKESLQKLTFREPSVLKLSMILNRTKNMDLLKDTPKKFAKIGVLGFLGRAGLGKAACDIVLAANLAKPGCLQSNTGIVLVNGQMTDSVRGFVGDLDFAVKEAEQIGWPPCGELFVKDVLEWLLGIPGFKYGFPTGKLGRAIAAISYLLKPSGSSDASMDILWALVALEALYCSGTTDVKRQLQERTELYLGQRTQHKKRFGTAYDFRSRFVHGDIDFPCEYNPYDAAEMYTNLQAEVWASSNITVAALISTLQKMCKEHRRQLDFRTIVADVEQGEAVAAVPKQDSTDATQTQSAPDAPTVSL